MLVAPIKNVENGMALPAKTNLPAETGVFPKGGTAEKPVQESKSIQLQGLANDVQQNLNIMHNVNLQFSVDEASGQTMITVKDETSGKVIREIPPKEMLDLAAKIDEMIGLLLDRKG